MHQASHRAVYLKNTGHVLNELFYATSYFNAPKTLVFLLALAAVAVLTRSRRLGLCWILYVAGVLPIALIPDRGLAQAWLPTAGLLIYAAILIVSSRDALSWRLAPASWQPAGQVLLFIVMIALMVRFHPGNRHVLNAWQPEYTRIREVHETLRRLCPAMRPRSTVLVVTDPLNGTHSTVFLLHLLYRDSSIVVDQLFRFEKPLTRERWASYDHVFDFVNGKVVRLNPADCAPPKS